MVIAWARDMTSLFTDLPLQWAQTRVPCTASDLRFLVDAVVVPTVVDALVVDAVAVVDVEVEVEATVEATTLSVVRRILERDSSPWVAEEFIVINVEMFLFLFPA